MTRRPGPLGPCLPRRSRGNAHPPDPPCRSLRRTPSSGAVVYPRAIATAATPTDHGERRLPGLRTHHRRGEHPRGHARRHDPSVAAQALCHIRRRRARIARLHGIGPIPGRRGTRVDGRPPRTSGRPTGCCVRCATPGSRRPVHRDSPASTRPGRRGSDVATKWSSPCTNADLPRRSPHAGGDADGADPGVRLSVDERLQRDVGAGVAAQLHARKIWKTRRG